MKAALTKGRRTEEALLLAREVTPALEDGIRSEHHGAADDNMHFGIGLGKFLVQPLPLRVAEHRTPPRVQVNEAVVREGNLDLRDEPRYGREERHVLAHGGEPMKPRSNRRDHVVRPEAPDVQDDHLHLALAFSIRDALVQALSLAPRMVGRQAQEVQEQLLPFRDVGNLSAAIVHADVMVIPHAVQLDAVLRRIPQEALVGLDPHLLLPMFSLLQHPLVHRQHTRL
mmetsp:Transcript_680/g.2599  ORF Transcript_680/g.2599 Transcript_680/m.2599 type:complete len:227 (+) Transcript_680:6163-6843(+)